MSPGLTPTKPQLPRAELPQAEFLLPRAKPQLTRLSSGLRR